MDCVYRQWYIIIVLLFCSYCYTQNFNITYNSSRPSTNLFVQSAQITVNYMGLYEIDMYSYKLYGGSTKLNDLIGVPDTRDNDWFNLYDAKSFNVLCGIMWFPTNSTFSINFQLCTIYYKKNMLLDTKFGISYYF